MVIPSGQLIFYMGNTEGIVGIMEIQMKKQVNNEMETGVFYGGRLGYNGNANGQQMDNDMEHEMETVDL